MCYTLLTVCCVLFLLLILNLPSTGNKQHTQLSTWIVQWVSGHTRQRTKNMASRGARGKQSLLGKKEQLNLSIRSYILLKLHINHVDKENLIKAIHDHQINGFSGR
jgi:cellobiose phosphorylase